MTTHTGQKGCVVTSVAISDHAKARQATARGSLGSVEDLVEIEGGGERELSPGHAGVCHITNFSGHDK